MRPYGDGVRVLVDARALNGSGLGRHIRSFLDGLLVDRRFSDVHLLGDRRVLEEFVGARGTAPRVRITDWHTALYSPGYQLAWLFDRRKRALTADAFFFPHYDAPFFLPERSIVVVHDLIHFRVPEAFSAWRRAAAGVLLQRVASRAAHVIVPSHATRRDLEERLPAVEGKISVIPLGFDAGFVTAQPASAEATAFARSLGPFLLCVGNRKAHKNLVAAVETLARLRAVRASLRLVVVGAWFPDWEPVRQRAAELGVEEAIVEPGAVDDDALRALYLHCDAFLFPSLYEGLGLPVLEAMAYGAPVVASDRSSIPELVGDAGLLVEPSDPDAVAGAVLRLWNEPELRARLAAKGRQRSSAFVLSHAPRRVADLLHAVAAAPHGELRRGWRQGIDLWPHGEAPAPSSAPAEPFAVLRAGSTRS